MFEFCKAKNDRIRVSEMKKHFASSINFEAKPATSGVIVSLLPEVGDFATIALNRRIKSFCR
jgi:hypothetical protein